MIRKTFLKGSDWDGWGWQQRGLGGKMDSTPDTLWEVGAYRSGWGQWVGSHLERRREGEGAVRCGLASESYPTLQLHGLQHQAPLSLLSLSLF